MATRLTYVKAQPVRLREVGLDERWLQDKIEDDPSILGLGDLSVLQRERKIPSGGRIDFLMHDPEESGLRYEVEVMLGRVDESHIVRTIEYWDIERQRYPNHQHRAVLVAEDLTARFLNVISLMNRAIPMIAIQMSAFQVDDKLVLHFAKLLDLAVESTAEDDVEVGEPVDRGYWERRTAPESMGATDKLMALIPGDYQVTFNKSHIALSTTGRNFCWIHPRRKHPHILVDVFVGDDSREDWIGRLDDSGIQTRPHSRDTHFKLRLTQREIAENERLLRELFLEAEGKSHGDTGN